jgi:4'-phosphopantetheinyl transferase
MMAAGLIRPADDEVHLWRVALDIDAWTLAVLDRVLSGDERKRAALFRSNPERQRFVAARGWMRRLLAAYLDIEPASIELYAGAMGKPRLADRYATKLTFNASRSRDLAVYAIGWRRVVGVDIEFVRGDVPMDAIARRYFDAEDRAALAPLPPVQKQQAFFRYWTRHEATLKACGVGLSSHPRVVVPPLSVRSFHAADGYAAAVATEGVAHVPSKAGMLDTLVASTCA